MGYPGFETQTLVWLSGRADAAGLRDALARLSGHHPVTAARLVGEASGVPCWQFRPDAVCPLHEADLSSADSQAVLDHAARLLSTPCDPAQNDPIRFHLLRRPDGRDVFLMQYTHSLMDNNAAVLVLREIGRESGEGWNSSGGVSGGRDPVRDYLRRFPRERRRQAAHATLALWGRCLRGGVGMLGRASAGGAEPARFGLAARTLGQAETRALQARVLSTCGYPSLSMALVGSAFRAVARMSPQRWAGGCNFLAGIGVDLGLRGKSPALFQNLVSLVPIHARSADLNDRDGLLRLLSRQFRERLEGDSDLGMLQLSSVLSRRPQQAQWVVDLVLRIGFSLWYAYFGSADGVGARFGGAAVENICFAGPSWSPVGLTLLVNQFGGRLSFQATYVPTSVPPSVADAFLDQVLGDLVG
jgi:hypothetical protein